PVACTPAAGWEKGQVKNQVGVVRERFFTPRLRVASYQELNAWLFDRCVAYAKAHKHTELTDRTIWQAFEAERPQLVPVSGPFDGFHAVQASVTTASLGLVRRKLKGSDDGDRQMVKVLSAVLSDGLAAVEAACAEALAGGVHSADVILNILARQRDPGPAATILTPDALRLRHAPIADCARYDSLRKAS